MLSAVTWFEYGLFVGLLLLLYYTVILLPLVRHRSLPSLTARAKSGTEDAARQLHLFDAGEDDFRAPASGSIEDMVYACMDELNAYLEQSKKTKCGKETMLPSLRRILEKYPAIGTSEYKESFVNVVKVQCETICGVHLGADEITRLWMRS